MFLEEDFITGNEAFLVSKESSLKVHKMLEYLIDTVGLKNDKQVIITWAIDNNCMIESPYGSSRDFLDEFLANVVKTENDIISETENIINIDYAKKIKKALLSYKCDIKQHERKIAIMMIDTVTPGRTSVTFYQEFNNNEYYQRISDWHENLKWEIEYVRKEKDNKGKEKLTYYEDKKPLTFIGAPSIDDIILAVYGQKKSKNDISYNKMKKNAREHLIHCIFSGKPLPQNMIFSAFHRATNPLSLEDKDAKNKIIRWYNWHKTLSVACALYKKYHFEKYKEEIQMELDMDRCDRDYLFGRLLAVADKIENVAQFKQMQGGKDLGRPTNAINLMSAFTNRPFQTWGIIYKQLNSYFKELNGANYYQNIIDEILTKFKNKDFENNNALSPLYLLGYSAQRKVLNNKNKSQEENKND